MKIKLRDVAFVLEIMTGLTLWLWFEGFFDAVRFFLRMRQ